MWRIDVVMWFDFDSVQSRADWLTNPFCMYTFFGGQETMYRLKSYGVKSTILFFGSARAKSKEQYDARLEELTKQVCPVPCFDH